MTKQKLGTSKTCGSFPESSNPLRTWALYFIGPLNHSAVVISHQNFTILDAINTKAPIKKEFKQLSEFYGMQEPLSSFYFKPALPLAQ